MSKEHNLLLFCVFASLLFSQAYAVEFLLDAVDSGRCVAEFVANGLKYDSPVSSLVCTVVHVASGYDLVSYGGAALSVGTSFIPGEAVDVGISTIKVVLKAAAEPLAEGTLKAATSVLNSSPALIGTMAIFVVKRGDDAVESSRSFIKLMGLGKGAEEATLKMLDDFGQLSLKQVDSLGRAVKGLGAEAWTQAEKKGLHTVIKEAEDAQGDAILTSMRKTGVWDDSAIKQAIELNPDDTLKNFKTKGFDLGGKNPDAKVTINSKEYYLESSSLENKITSNNLQNVKGAFDREYLQFSTDAAKITDNSIVIVLEEGSDLTTAAIENELKLIINTPDQYKNLKRAFVVDKVTGEVAKIIR